MRLNTQPRIAFFEISVFVNMHLKAYKNTLSMSSLNNIPTKINLNYFFQFYFDLPFCNVLLK